MTTGRHEDPKWLLWVLGGFVVVNEVCAVIGAIVVVGWLFSGCDVAQAACPPWLPAGVPPFCQVGG